MKVFSGPDAWANLIAQNPHSRWNTAPQNDDFVRTANARMTAGAFVAEYQVPAKMKAGDRVFCIGSCFARNVEKALRDAGIDVASGRLGDEKTTSPDLFNIYNTHSMLNELRWALDPAAPFRAESFLAVGEGYLDPHTSLAGAVRSLPQCQRLRESVIGLTRNAADSNFVIITLGLTEAWFDTEHDTYLNVAPPRSLTLSQPSRFELRVLDYGANIQALEQIVDLLTRHGRPDMQLILTVSPVPFVATFSDQDVVAANTYSKSTLRCVAQDFANRNSRVHYIPIYESVMNSHPEITWEIDRIHVDRDIVRLNINNFLAKALDDPERSAAAEREVAGLKAKLGARRPAPASPAPATPTMQTARLPLFETLDDASVDEQAFPAGFPAIVATSQQSEEFGTASLMKGANAPWHSGPNAPFPHALDMRFRSPIHCVRFWMQSQNRNADRAPTCFALLAGNGPDEWHEVTRMLTHKWTNGGEWGGFETHFQRPWPYYRLTILTNDHPQLTTLQRLWLEPDTWERRRDDRRRN